MFSSNKWKNGTVRKHKRVQLSLVLSLTENGKINVGGTFWGYLEHVRVFNN